MEYQFRQGFRARAVKPGVAAAELERMRGEGGSLTAEAVFEASIPEDAPLHGEFVWDGDEAVRKLGLMRSREIIRAVVKVVESDSQRVYVHIPSMAGAGVAGTYEPISVVVRQVDLFERALEDLQRKFDAAAEALNELKTATQGTDNADRLAAIGLAVQGFGAVREALAILK